MKLKTFTLVYTLKGKPEVRAFTTKAECPINAQNQLMELAGEVRILLVKKSKNRFKVLKKYRESLLTAPLRRWVCVFVNSGSMKLGWTIVSALSAERAVEQVKDNYRSVVWVEVCGTNETSSAVKEVINKFLRGQYD